MNPYHRRLLNVIRSVEEAPAPDRFRMSTYGYAARRSWFERLLALRSTSCGTPACVLGHYACRPDLQRTFRLDQAGNLRAGTHYVECDGAWVRTHFGLSRNQAEALFGPQGCGDAQTTEEAIAYLRAFIEREYPTLTCTPELTRLKAELISHD